MSRGLDLRSYDFAEQEHCDDEDECPVLEEEKLTQPTRVSKPAASAHFQASHSNSTDSRDDVLLVRSELKPDSDYWRTERNGLSVEQNGSENSSLAHLLSQSMSCAILCLTCQ